MSTFRKHFGLTAKDESCIFKELEKVRQRTRTIRRRSLWFKQRLDFSPPLSSSSEEEPPDQDKEERPRSSGRKRSKEKKGRAPWPGAQGAKLPATADLQGARRRPGKRPPFCPREFYMRSSAYRRFGPFTRLPVIATQAGTARPALLLRHITRIRRPRSKGPVAQVSKRVYFLSPAQESRLLDVVRQRYRQASSLSSLSSEADEGKSRRLRFHTHYLRQAASWAQWPSRTSSGSPHEGRSTSQIFSPGPITRSLPTSIEEIIASLQSEAQQAADQTIKELIESILGQNYEDIMTVPEKCNLSDFSVCVEETSGSASHGILPGQKKHFLKVPLYERQIRCPSVPTQLNFDNFVQRKGGIPKNTNPLAWVIETFAKDKPQKAHAPVLPVQKDVPEIVTEIPKLELSDNIKCNLPEDLIAYYEAEVERLTQEIGNEKQTPVFAYCRRGAIYRKLGKLQSAMNDLQETIFVEPMFLNAYWHRHFIYLFQDKFNDALDDLNFIHKYNKNHAEAYLSKAEIFKERKDFTLAILNYSQAIKCRPTDADLYFRRGELYEKTNKVLAMDDFSKCIHHDPKRTDALMKRAMFYFENENWSGATSDFTSLIKLEPQNSQARTSRGRAYFKRHFYKQATEDFSVAIHLDPNNWLALYYRACLFRKSNPLRALQDYSVSALINDGYENLNCFLHRGILYTQLKHWMLAVSDFETVIFLERSATVAYINIGLVYLLHLDNYTEAFWWFSEAIRIDPLYIQSYLCRAETYHKLHTLKKAVNELSRAIHLQPDAIQLYIIRGQYLLFMKCFDLAKFTIYQVAEMNKGLIELTPVQQALTYSFCENHDKAIQVLEAALVNKPDISTFALLAKAQMKANKIKESVRTFKKTLDMFSNPEIASPPTSVLADCLYNLGLCYIEEGNLHMAFDSFTRAVQANAELAEAFYYRGICKVKLNKENPILDFNRAITFNPKHYQAYLSRVAYYGLEGRYSKAILNCNEAIRLYPESVRAYICRGVLKCHSKNYKLAFIDLTTAINMDKNCYIAYYNRAVCYTKMRELHMALRDYGIVLLLNPGEHITLSTFVNRGLIYNELKQYGFAIEDFKQAVMISQNNVNLCQATAMCHHRIKEFEDAVNFFTRAIKINPLFLDAYVGRGNSYMEYEKHEAMKRAQKDFLRALRFDPSSSKARISLGYNLQAQGKFQKAWNHFTIALEADPKSYLAYEGRAVVCLQMRNNFAAMQDINAAIKINTTAEFLTNRGVIHEFMGHRHNAMEDYQAAISLDPTYSLAYFNAGNIYFHHRQFSQAKDYYSKALKYNPESGYGLMNQAVTNTILKKYEEAKNDFSRAIEHCPHWAALYINRASFHLCSQRYELAEKDLGMAVSLKPNESLAYHLRAQVRGKLGQIEEAMKDYNQALNLEEYSKAM
ncbi:tetratricopeptide repeat protein 6 [Psammomys obesus]|uniref:tetratricopeptide repeat protein 6 n=1 Tax=Psammomys obesus TaxID=48139 RepID=UPI0024530ED3|nr:tetratricopeptide repeat protein 6 [Psammomys obesus]